MGWNETVENGLKYDIGRKGIACTSYVQELIHETYGVWCRCNDTEYPIDWIENATDRKRIEDFFVIIDDVTKAKKYDIGVYRKYNMFGHSGILLEDYNSNEIMMLSANKDGDGTVREWKHHTYNLEFVLRPKENMLPEIHFDLLQGNNKSITVGGWCKDIKNPDKALAVHVYNCDDNSNKKFIGELLANEYREDVGNHSFCITFSVEDIGKHKYCLYAIDSVDSSKNTKSEIKECDIDFDVSIGDTITFDRSCMRPYNNYDFYQHNVSYSVGGIVKDQHEGVVIDISTFNNPKLENFNYLVRTSNTYVFVNKKDIKSVT